MGLFDKLRGGSGNPADISKMLQDKERAEMVKAQAEYREKMERVADEIHDILLREDLSSDDTVQVFRLITQDIGTVAGKIKLTTLYGVPRQEADGSGEGGEEGGESPSERGSEEASQG